MEKILSISDQLQKLLDEAKREAERVVAEAQKNADEMISQTKAEIEMKLIRDQRFSKQTEEEKIKIESIKILEEYRKKATSLKNITDERFMTAIKLILSEVLPE